MRNVIVEVCCNSVEDAFTAKSVGADRIELNSGLLLGGLTPSVGEMMIAKEADICTMAMVRPREGSFCYTDREFAVMLHDAKALIEAGADGIVFGITHADGTVDKERSAEMMRVIGDKQSVFHRAIDKVPDWRKALDTLMELGVTRILTGGQEHNAIDGAATLREMMAYTNGRLEICPGGGVRPHNVVELVEKSGCNQVHTSMRKNFIDASGRTPAPLEDSIAPRGDIHIACDAPRIKEMLENLDR